MSIRKLTALVGALISLSQVAAHGVVTGVIANGKYFPGYTPSLQYQSPPPGVVGWSIPEDSNLGFISPDIYTLPDIICHKEATNAKTSVTVQAGGTVELQWTAWPATHHGPVIDYLANCKGDCTTVDKTKLRFVKIHEAGLLNYDTIPGSWASDKIMTNNNSWTLTIPESIAPGSYVLRHEIIALHSADVLGGAQHYPQCINLKVSGAGTESLSSGTLGTALYKETDPGIDISIYKPLSNYVCPGPRLYNGTDSIARSTLPTTTSVVSATATSSVPSYSSAMTTSAAVILSSSSAVYPGNYNSTSTAAASVFSTVTKSRCSKASNATSSSVAAAFNLTITASATITPTTGIAPNYPLPTSAIPTSIFPTSASIPALPDYSGVPPSGTTTSRDPIPATLPQGVTLKKLLEWVEIVLSDLLQGKSPPSKRSHARDRGIQIR